MNKPIIIDGVNVAECEFFELWEKQFNREYGCLIRIKGHKICKNKKNCYYKQLQRQEQENIRLEAENTKLIEENYELSVNQDDVEQYKTIIHNKNIDIRRLKVENKKLKKEVSDLNFYIDSYRQTWELDKYKQALEYVREITKKYYLSDKKLLATGIEINPYNAIIEIQDKINEVLGD